MEIRLIKKEKDSMELEVVGEDETLLEPLKQKLLEDKNVELATYLLGHPMLENPKIFVKVKSGKPQAAFKKAAKALTTEYDDFNTLIVKGSSDDEE